jgi:CBS domain containing-hemolysin-like protein
MRTALALIAVLLIVLANGFFVAAEYALVTMRRTRVQELVDQGSRGARRVADLQQNPARFISAIQLGVTLSSLALGAIGEPVISNLLDTPLGWLPDSWHGGVALTISAILAFSILSFFHVVLGEIVPKSYTLQHAERVALVVATPINVFYAIFRPFIWALVAASAAVLRWLGLPPGARRSSVHSEEELKMLVTASREQGVLEEEEQTMLHKVFEFADKDAADVMVPRPDVVALPLELPVAELLRLMLQHPYTRYPVYDGELDDVVGVLHVRDLFAALHDRGIDGWTRGAPLGDHGSRDEAARRAAVRLRDLEPHGDRGGRVRLAGGSPPGDPLEEIVARSATSSICRTPASGGWARVACGWAGRSRSRSSTSGSARRCPTRTTTASAASCSASSAARPRWATPSGPTACGSR